MGNIPRLTKERETKNWCARKLPENSKTVINPDGSKHTSGLSKWKYTDNTNDPDCATNWNYYNKDGKTLILGNIPRLTKERDTKNWCTLKPVVKTLTIKWTFNGQESTQTFTFPTSDTSNLTINLINPLRIVKLIFEPAQGPLLSPVQQSKLSN